MQVNFDKLKYLVGDKEVLIHSADTPALPVFSPHVIGFLSALSRALLNNKNARNFPDVISYAYWIRRASILSVRDRQVDSENRIGRGMAFHIAPSNIPVQFAVTMTSSLLAGNISIIKISDKSFDQVGIICDEINILLEQEFAVLKPYFCLVRYGHDDSVTEAISAMCDIRIIWGGNETVRAIRQIPLPPRAVEMTFADRYSIAIINSDKYMIGDKDAIAKDFYTDTYYIDQNACSSPRLVVWIGKQSDEARKIFWDKLGLLAEREYNLQPIQAIDKMTSFCMFGMTREGVHLETKDNYIVRAEVESLYPEMMDYKEGGGYFFEYVAVRLEDIVPILTKSCQTVAYYGLKKGDILSLIFEHGVRGVDRIMPIGQTLGMEMFWDGFKMIDAMSRYVYVGGE